MGVQTKFRSWLTPPHTQILMHSTKKPTRIVRPDGRCKHTHTTHKHTHTPHTETLSLTCGAYAWRIKTRYAYAPSVSYIHHLCTAVYICLFTCFVLSVFHICLCVFLHMVIDRQSEWSASTNVCLSEGCVKTHMCVLHMVIGKANGQPQANPPHLLKTEFHTLPDECRVACCDHEPRCTCKSPGVERGRNCYGRADSNARASCMSHTGVIYMEAGTGAEGGATIGDRTEHFCREAQGGGGLRQGLWFVPASKGERDGQGRRGYRSAGMQAAQLSAFCDFHTIHAHI